MNYLIFLLVFATIFHSELPILLGNKSGPSLLSVISYLLRDKSSIVGKLSTLQGELWTFKYVFTRR